MCDLLDVSVKIQSGRGGAQRKGKSAVNSGTRSCLPRPFASLLPLGLEYKAGKRAFTPNRPPPPFPFQIRGCAEGLGRGDGNGCGIPNLVP